MQTVMVICPHADDAAAFCGGTVARFADANAFGGSPLDAAAAAADDEKKEVGSLRRRARNSRVRASHRAASSSSVKNAKPAARTTTRGAHEFVFDAARASAERSSAGSPR